MNEMNQDQILVLIVRNLSGLADLVEIAQLEEWIENSEANKKYFEEVSNVWAASDKHLDIQKINTEKALKNVLKTISDLPSEKTFWFYWQKIAAVIILPLILGTLYWIYFNNQKETFVNEPIYSEIYAAYGTRTSIRLADSTLVWLNSGSSMRYPDKFLNKSRIVYLKGEAYFEVKSDVTRPFIVQTKSLVVKATGTKFSVLEYNSNPKTQVTLVSGKVSVNTTDKTPKLISELHPNQHLEFNTQTEQMQISNDDAYKFIAWTDGKLIFRNDPFIEVARKISQYYNVDIKLHGSEMQDYRYRATFQDESLDEVLKLLKLSSPISIVESKRTPLPDGSFSKKKIVIYPLAH